MLKLQAANRKDNHKTNETFVPVAAVVAVAAVFVAVAVIAKGTFVSCPLLTVFLS